MPRSGEARITIIHHNVPNMLAQISDAVSKEHINIENMLNKSKGDYAYTIVDIGSTDNLDNVIANLNKINSVLKVSLYKQKTTVEQSTVLLCKQKVTLSPESFRVT